MGNKIKVLTVFFLLLLTACTKEVNLDDIKLEPKICLYCLYTAGNRLNIYLCKTGNAITQTGVVEINDATVVLWSNNVEIEHLTYDSAGYYSTKSYRMEAGKSYTITVDVPGFERIVATDSVPDVTPILKDSVIKNNYIVEGQLFSTLFFDFYDRPNEHNYYMIAVVFQYLNEQTGKVENWAIPVRSDNAIIVSDENHQTSYGLRESFFYLIFDDSNISERPTKVFFYYFSGNDEILHSFFKFYSLSRNMYKYYQSINISGEINNRALFGNINVYQQNDYYNLFSNIQNGIGIFAGCSIDIDTIK